MPGSVLWLGVDGWPWAVVLAAKVSTGKTFRKPVEHYVGEYPFWDAVAWAVQAVDTPCLGRQGYEGVLEHVVVRFVARCSRICSHELVRHRLASYAQTSTRLGGFHATGYAEKIRELCQLFDEGEISTGALPSDGKQFVFSTAEADKVINEVCIIPPGDGGAVRRHCLEYLRQVCEALEHGGGKRVDDVLRYAQPDALAAHIMVTTNLREVLHIAGLRLHPHAHWEIRSLVKEIVDKLWEHYRVPIHLMLLLKRPGLASLDKQLREKATQQLKELEENLGEQQARKIKQLASTALAAAWHRGNGGEVTASSPVQAPPRYTS